jgi:DNA-binding NarL/FixJ family response regulator
MKVFIVEDSETVREHLQGMLSHIPGVSVVGYAGDELGAIKRIGKLLPDVVTHDLNLKPGSGITVLEYIKKNHPSTKTIVLTNYVDDYYIKACKDVGADHVFDKILHFQKVASVFWKWVNDACTANKVCSASPTSNRV